MEINNALELKKYKESKEFKDLLDKYNNKAENIRARVLIDLKSGKCSKEMIAGEDDKLILIGSILQEIAEEIKDEGIGATLLKENLLRNCENIDYTLVRQIMDMAKPIYTKKCIELVKAGEYGYLEARIDGLIALEERGKEEESDDVYDKN